MPFATVPQAPSRHVAGLVLAAGAGRRFGGPKAIAAVDEELFVERAIRILVEGGCGPIFVVLGSAAKDVIARANLERAQVVIADDWAHGLSASLQTGLGAVTKSDADAVVIVLVDQPWIGAASVSRLREAWMSGAVAAVATYNGQVRNPVLLDRGVWDDVIQSAVGDTGARTWLREHPDHVVTVSCDDTGSPADVDTPEDLANSWIPRAQQGKSVP